MNENDAAKTKSAHDIRLSERREMTLTGIEAVDGFDTESVIMHTSEDGLSVQGHELHIDKFDADTGRLMLSGVVDAIVYFDMKRHGKKTGSARGKQSFH
ncbi:MAG: YabP/YqfC family sporulation protein [Firmicutes bacterium]|nr:YabP/YqfC family sporulation protein [Bacillota bacterium]